MQIADNMVVSIHYTLKDDNGNVLDSSEGKEPLKYLSGGGNIIPGLEKALAGKAIGDSVQASIPPVDAYGERVDAGIQQVPRDAFAPGQEIEVGMMFQAQMPEGGTQNLTVAAVDGDNITIDANHPLAGQTLHFDVKIEDVREATEEEAAHGHAH